MFNGRIYLCADIHGDNLVVKDIINQIDNPTPEDVIIVCGDAGFEYQNYDETVTKRAARKFPGNWVVLRGNHDSSYWKEHTFEDTDTALEGWSIIRENGGAGYLCQNKYPNILYVRDCGGIYKIGEYNFLMLPGAYSVDKEYRLRRHFPWNPNEQLTTEEMNNLYDLVCDWNKQGFYIDYVIGHTFPMFMEPYYRYLFLDSINQLTVDKRTEQWLGSMAELYEKNPAFKGYYGGHFHDTRRLNNKYMMLYHDVVELGE